MPLGFKRARSIIIECLRSGDYAHWPRDNFQEKNWLAANRITVDQLASLLGRCNGTQHRPGKEPAEEGTEVHEFLPEDDGVRWYIKASVDTDSGDLTIHTVIMSVHPSGQ
jgi:hypothetical protein